MAEWKTQVAYNYNPAYHTYAYSLVYQSVPEQNNGNLTGWGDNGVTDLSNYNGGATQSICTAVAPTTAMTEEESPPLTPETVTGNCYQGTGLVYLSDAQAGHLLVTGPPREAYPTGESELRRARSDSVSDSEAHISPDSWSSVSSREGSLPQVDPTTWTEKDVGEKPVVRSPDDSQDVSSSFLEESQNLAIHGNEVRNSSPHATPKKQGASAKVKVRIAFTESQMNTLLQRFSVQRYLTPAEMKNLAEMSGLTYKQVKTWFQNRRMKLRRQQKDTSWVSERYAIHKDGSAHRPVISNMASHVPTYQGDGRPQIREHYNQHMMEAAYKKTPQNMAYYLAAVGGAAMPAGYSPWSTDSPQATLPNRRHAAGWVVPQGGGPFDYNPNAFNSNSYMQTPRIESKEVEPVSSSLNHDGNQ